MLRYGFKPLGGPNTSDIIMPCTSPLRLVREFTSISATSREEWFVVRNLLLPFTTLSIFSSVFVAYSCCTSFFNCSYCFLCCLAIFLLDFVCSYCFVISSNAFSILSIIRPIIVPCRFVFGDQFGLFVLLFVLFFFCFC